MLSERYGCDGKSAMKLNKLQEEAKKEFVSKMKSNKYKFAEYNCECGSGLESMELLAAKDRYGLPVETRICKKCGLVMTNPYMTQESLNSFYDNEYRKLYNGEEYEDITPYFEFQNIRGYNLWNWISSQIDTSNIKNILEIGTGSGGILWAIKRMNPKVNVTGIDLGSRYIEYGKNKGINLIVSDSKSWGEKISEEEKYDLIILSQVLEHFLDLKEELDSVKRLLSPRGVLFVGVPGIMSIDKGDSDFLMFLQNAHVRHFSLGTLTQVMKKYGFSLVAGDEEVNSIFKCDMVVDSLGEKNYYPETMAYLVSLEEKKKTKSVIKRAKSKIYYMAYGNPIARKIWYGVRRRWIYKNIVEKV